MTKVTQQPLSLFPSPSRYSTGVDSGLDSDLFFLFSLETRSHCIVMSGPELARLVLNANPPTSISRVLALQVCATKPRAEASFRMGLKNWQKFS